MKINPHGTESNRIAHIEDAQLSTFEDSLDLLGDMYFQGYNAMILGAKDLPQDFFDLSSGVAGEILQKFSNFRMKLAIVGLPESSPSQSLMEFMRESNKLGRIVFCNDLNEALEKLR